MRGKVEVALNVFMAVLLVMSSVFAMDTGINHGYIQISVFVVFILYCVYRLMKKEPVKIIGNKLDVFVLLLVLSTTVSLICNTYVSLYGTVQAILQYLYVWCVYVLIREITRNVSGFGKIITSVLIFSSVCLIFVGLDGITFNSLEKALEKIGIVISENGDSRLVSTFGCATALGAYIASVMFLNFDEMLENSKLLVKSIYKTITFILLIGIILTYSKGVFVVLAFAILLYIALLKNNKKRIEIIENIIAVSVFSVIFLNAFDSLFNVGNFILLWVVFGILIITSFIVNIMLEKINELIENKSTKRFWIAFITIWVVILLYVVIGLNVVDKYTVFTNKVSSNYKVKIINNIEGNTNYLLEFDIEAAAENDETELYTIKIIQKNVKNQELCSTELNFGSFNGIKNIEINTKQETTEFRIEFTVDEKCTDKKLVVNNLKINGKTVALKYKYLPTKLVEKIKSINFKYKTLQERKEMIANALELAKENPLTGIGGNGWQYEYKDVQKYNYTARKIHSYPAKVFLEYGTIGIIAYLAIFIVIIIETIKNRKITSITFAVLILMLHSVIDTDMEYTHILIYTFGTMGVISKNMKKAEKTSVLTYLVDILIVLIIAFGIFQVYTLQKYDVYEKIADLLRSRNGLRKTSNEYLEINKQIANQYEKILLTERYNYLSIYEKIVNYYLNSNCENKADIMENYYDKILKYESKNPEKCREEKILVVGNIVKRLGQYDSSEFYDVKYNFINLIINEYEKIESEDEKNLEEIYDYSKTIKQLYILGARVINQTDIIIDEEKLGQIEPNVSKKIIVYQTHGTESYKSSQKYEMYKFYRTTDSNYNVIKIGNRLSENLSQKGYEVIHDTQYFDLPTTEGAYGKSKIAVEKLLMEDINTIIDVHRDAISNTEHEATTVKINGEDVAQLRFVIGINLDDTDWMNHLKLAIDIQKRADRKYPGLFKPIIIRESTYNQDIVENAILIEVGENCNTIEEAIRGVEYFAEIF